ncbi:polysaccharide deacetylase family protein [Paenibacillus sp. GD4]|uniref:polysaccharide deacetylase family protein n=1 Tax=Paenibacillus sp. GD4 TaxID=3068890 RepID=UPI002796CAF6|nr:polysaccharide deacetylase family protein [Paenibacillus sp. GD4]MDQ1910007.1 polysaccharide deacetylase family protein [Paenibacillus sp. GD4]
MNKLWKQGLVLLVLVLSLTFPAWNEARSSTMYEDQVAVLMYHHVSDEATSSSTITTKLFHDQLAYLQSKGYHFITLQEFKNYMQGASVPVNAVLVTFDDGYESYYTNAYPILKKLQIPAVNFVISGDLDNPNESNIPFLSRDHIRTMTRETDFIDLQCHTDALHYKLEDNNAALVGRFLTDGVRETEEQYKQRILADTKACISKVSELYPAPVDTFAYPFGINDELSRGLLKQAGIRYAFTIVPEMASRAADPMRIPRINGGHPSISPEGLHASILYRVIAKGASEEQVPVEEALRQLGGQATVHPNGRVELFYGNRRWEGNVRRSELVSPLDGVIRLQQPLMLRSSKLYMGLKDLEQAIGTQIVYNPSVPSFTVRQTPTVKQ